MKTNAKRYGICKDCGGALPRDIRGHYCPADHENRRVVRRDSVTGKPVFAAYGQAEFLASMGVL